MRATGITLIMATMFAGCGLTMQSDDRIRANTAGVLGLSPDEVTIENGRQDFSTTYYVAKTRSGVEYACTILRGPVTGLGVPPVCNKKGEPPQSTNPLMR
jgi:hypothetical protein